MSIDDFGKPDGIRALLGERESTHGRYIEQATTGEALRGIMQDARNWHVMSPVQRDALMMISVKISRILNGKHKHPDTWKDIAGYATLVQDYLESGK